jgi:LysM repeat protein
MPGSAEEGAARNETGAPAGPGDAPAPPAAGAQAGAQAGDQQPYREEIEFVDEHEARLAELFAAAVDRLDEGESVHAIIADLPAADAEALRSLLEVSQTLLAIQAAPLPQRNPARLRARRTEFLEQIALEQTRARGEALNAEPVAAISAQSHSATATSTAAGLQRLGATVPTQDPPKAAPGRATARPAGRGWLQRLSDGLAFGRMRLTPLLLTLSLALGGALGLARVTQASLPGDLTYPLKAWVQMMNLSMAAPDQRVAVGQQAAQSIQADIVESANRAEERAAGSTSALPEAQRESVTLIFDGYDGRLLKFGDVRVLPTWQPNLAEDASLPMEVVGDLTPGALVRLTVQILPGQGDLVQGVRAVVQESAAPPAAAVEPPAAAQIVTGPATSSEPPAEGAEMLVIPAATDSTPVPCTPRLPADWGAYTVVRGDNLTRLARASGTTVREIAGANCLYTDVIVIGQQLFLPLTDQLDVILPTATPTLAPTQEPTATVAPTEAPTEAPTATATAEPTAEPTATPIATLTEAPTEAPTELPTVAPTVEPTVAPTVEPVTVPTTEPTTEPTAVPTALPQPIATLGPPTPLAPVETPVP